MNIEKAKRTSTNKYETKEESRKSLNKIIWKKVSYVCFFIRKSKFQWSAFQNVLNSIHYKPGYAFLNF